MTSQSIRRVGAALAIPVLVAIALTTSDRGDAPAAPRSYDAHGAGHYVVLLEDSVSHPAVLARRHAANHDARLTYVYRSAIKGYAATMTASAAAAAGRDPAVLSVEPDMMMEPAGEEEEGEEGEEGEEPVPQDLTHNLERVFVADSYEDACEDPEYTPSPGINPNFGIDCVDDKRVDVDIAVIDGGVDDDEDVNLYKRVDCAHPENPYSVRTRPYVPPPGPEDPNYELWHPSQTLGGESGCLENSGEPGDLTGYDEFPEDNGGHGLAVARRVAGVDNDIGLVGLATGARVWSLKLSGGANMSEGGMLPALVGEGVGPGVAAYSFNEGEGSILHDTGNEHLGTLEGATWDPNGKYGAALRFDGKDDRVTIADDVELDGHNSFTLTAWVRPETLTEWTPVLAKRGSEPLSGVGLYAQGDQGTPAGRVFAGSSATVNAPVALKANEWSFLSFSSDGEYLRFYVNGQPVGKVPALDAASNSADLLLGHDPVTGTYFKGLIDELRIWSVAWPNSRMPSLMVRPIPTHAPDPPIAAYAFNEGTGTTLTDVVGDHDGTIEGATWEAFGKRGRALAFDGTDDLVKIADANDLDLTGSFTLEAWVRPDTLTDGSVLTKGETPGGKLSGYWLNAAYTEGKPAGIAANSGTVKTVSGPSALPTEVWSHLALTSDGETLRLYVGGKLVASEAAVAVPATSAPLKIGQSLTGHFDGLIDEVIIYDQTLTEAQIKRDLKAPVLYDPNLALSSGIAAVDYVHEHADEIEVAQLIWGCALPWEGAPEQTPIPRWVRCSKANGEALNAAIDATVEEGVVFVAAAGNTSVNTTSIGSPQNNPNVIVSTTSLDVDGVPTMTREPFEIDDGMEDVKPVDISYGSNVTIASPFVAAFTSGSTPYVAGAAAVLASQCDPDSAEDVHHIMDTLVGEGNPAARVTGGWDDNSHDGHKEALLDLGNEEVFDPVMIGEEQPQVSCDFSHPRPVAAYSFDEGSGASVRDSAGSHDGSVEGASWTASGRYGPALDFDGTNNLVKVADAADLDLTKTFTLEAWVKPDSVAATRPVIAKGVNSPLNGYTLGLDETTAKPRGWIASEGSFKSAAAPSGVSTGAWSHLAATYDGKWLRVYVNGELEESKETTLGAGVTAANLEIGHSVFSSSYFDGLIDEVRVYDEVLNENQVEGDMDTRVGLDQAPVAAYSFDEGSGASVRDHARNHDGEIEGARWVTGGKYGPALDFDGTNDWVKVADAADLDLTKTFTLEAWVKPDSLSSPIRSVLAKAENPGTGLTGYQLLASFAGKPGGYVANAGTVAIFGGPNALPTGQWSHVALSSDGATLRLYVNGSQVATAAAIAAAGTAAPLRIGHNPVSNGYFDGLIDEVRVYNEAIGQGQIESDRDAPVNPPPPVAAYSFEEGSGTAVEDWAGIHDAAVEGATWTVSGRHGGALDFDGTNDLVKVADAPDLDLTKTFTLEAWVKPDSLSGASAIAKAEAPGGKSSGYWLSAANAGAKPAGTAAAAGSSAGVEGPASLPTGQWSHVALSSDGTTLRLYVNAKQVATAAAIDAAATAATLEVGHNPVTGGYFDGLIDEVRVYNQALGRSQIEADLDSGG
jgi:hypothetical protein